LKKHATDAQIAPSTMSLAGEWNLMEGGRLGDVARSYQRSAIRNCDRIRPFVTISGQSEPYPAIAIVQQGFSNQELLVEIESTTFTAI
jgi:hypothetical protein